MVAMSKDTHSEGMGPMSPLQLSLVESSGESCTGVPFIPVLPSICDMACATASAEQSFVMCRSQWSTKGGGNDWLGSNGRNP